MNKKQQENQDYTEYSFLRIFSNVHKVKSIARAMRRGNVSPLGVLAPKRPFNNRANTSERKKVHSRGFNQNKKMIYAELRRYGKRFDLLY